MSLLNYYNSAPNSKEEAINSNQLYSELKKNALSKKLSNNCLICGGKNIKFCKSHTLPRFLLKNFTQDGKLYNAMYFANSDYIAKELGVQNTQIFYDICYDCDSKLFQEYENPNNYTNIPNQKMLKEIVLKNHLYYTYKLNRDINIFKQLNEMEKTFSKKSKFSDVIKCHQLDFYEIKNRIQEAYNDINNQCEKYIIGYYNKLNYKAPIAVQTSIALYYDFVGKKLNNPFSKKSLDYLHTCIFPHESGSIIFLFYEKSKHKFDKFFQDLNNLDEDTQLAIINYMVLMYTDDVFINKQIVLTENEKANLDKACYVPVSVAPKRIANKQKKQDFKEMYSLNRFKEVTNLLNCKFKIV